MCLLTRAELRMAVFRPFYVRVLDAVQVSFPSSGNAVLDLDNLTDVRLSSSSNSVLPQVTHHTTPGIWFGEAGKQDHALVPSGRSRLSGTIGQLWEHRAERGLGILAFLTR